MSALMVRPGPLEGGPMVSPGPAKESGEPFSAHLKHACDTSQGNSTSAPQKSAQNPSDESERPAEENDGSPKEAAPPKVARPVGSSRESKGRIVPTKGSENNAEALPVEVAIDPVLVDPSLSNNAAVIPLLGDTSTKEDIDTSLPLLISVVVKDSPVDPMEVSEAVPADSETEIQEKPAKNKELVKNDVKSMENPGPVLPPMDPPAVMLAAPSLPVEEEISLAPVKGDSVLVPVALPAADGPIPAMEGSTSAVNPEKETGFPAKMSDLKSPEQHELPKKKAASPSLPNDRVGEKTPSDRPAPSELADSSPMGIRPESTGPAKQKIGKEVQNDSAPVKEGPLPSVVFQPEVVSQVPLVTEGLPKLKDVQGIPPVPSAAAAHVGVPVQLSPEPVQTTAPVLEGGPAKAGPVVTPSPVDLAQQIHVHLESGRSVVRIDLHPEHLGELRISMETKGKDVSMQFTVDNDTARTTVVAGLREITGTLSSLGWTVNGLAVHVSSGGVGNGRGDAQGSLWTQGQNMSNTLPSAPDVSVPKQRTGEWRVDLVA